MDSPSCRGWRGGYLTHNGITAAPTIEQLPYLVQGGGHTMPGTGRGGAAREALVGKTSQDFEGLRTIGESFMSCPPRRQTDFIGNDPFTR